MKSAALVLFLFYSAEGYSFGGTMAFSSVNADRMTVDSNAIHPHSGAVYSHSRQGRRHRHKDFSVCGVYRFQEEHVQSDDVWIVDGNTLRDSVFDEWIYGGNSERYPFIPAGEIWIDNDINCQEYRYTLAHERQERDLMAQLGWSYTQAHDSALMLENGMRHADSVLCSIHETQLDSVPPFDDDSTQELVWLPSLIKLSHVYLEKFDTIGGLTVWIVDGNVIRRDIFPDFGFSGNDRSYLFIPQNEIWLDNAMSSENIKFSILTESKERELISQGMPFADAYTRAVHEALHAMHTSFIEARHRPPIVVPTPPYRDTGTGVRISQVRVE